MISIVVSGQHILQGTVPVRTKLEGNENVGDNMKETGDRPGFQQ